MDAAERERPSQDLDARIRTFSPNRIRWHLAGAAAGIVDGMMTERATAEATATATAEARPSLPPRTGTLRLPDRARTVPANAALATAPAAASPIPTEAAAGKATQMQREREEHQAAVLRRRQELDGTLAALRDRWPALFTAPVPLAIGIERKIQQTLGEARFPKVRLRRALHCWTHRTGYLVAIAEGRRRQDLDGSDAGKPEEAHCAYARELVAERLAKRPPRHQQHRS